MQLVLSVVRLSLEALLFKKDIDGESESKSYPMQNDKSLRPAIIL